MALNIKDTETERLASEVADLTGESKTGEILTYLRERKARVALQHPANNREQALRALLEQKIWPALPPGVRGHAPSADEQDEILGYEPHEP
jgi:antitoxin VapB